MLWLHKQRTAMVRSDSEPLGLFVQIGEALVGEKTARTRNSCWSLRRHRAACASSTS